MKKLLFLIIIFIISYTFYTSVNRIDLEKMESKHQVLSFINNFLRNSLEFLTWKEKEITSKTNEYYGKNVAPKVNDIKTSVSKQVDNIKTETTVKLNETKTKIDTIRKTLSWAEDTVNKAEKAIQKWKEVVSEVNWVLSDVDKMRDWIMWAVNTWAVR